MFFLFCNRFRYFFMRFLFVSPILRCKNSNLLLYICLKLFPGIFVFHKIFRTDFSCHIIMADHILTCKSESVTQPGCQLYHRLISHCVKSTCIIRMTAFDGYGIPISIIRSICNFRSWYTLHNFPLQPYNKMTAGFCALSPDLYLRLWKEESHLRLNPESPVFPVESGLLDYRRIRGTS